MAELAAVSTLLLRVITDEALLLGRVGKDVQFIREEMESMKSFLERMTLSSGGEYDRQIRPWKNQVRQLAQDSNFCIDMYLSRCDPEIHHARGGLRRCVWWLPWFLQKMAAQHRAAIQLRHLKERARDIADRRLRYAIEAPANRTTSELLAVRPELMVDDEDADDQLVVEMAVADNCRVSIFQPRTPEENVRVKLADWIQNVLQGNTPEEKTIAVVAPDKEETLALAMEASSIWKKRGAYWWIVVLLDIPAMHSSRDRLESEDILYYILRVLRQQGQGHGEEEQDIDNNKRVIYSEKQNLFHQITENIKSMKLDNKISEIKDTITQMKGSQRQLNLEGMNGDQLALLKSSIDEPLGVLLRSLWLLKQNPGDGSSATKPIDQNAKEATLSERKEPKPRSYEDIIKETAKNLKMHIEENSDENQNPKDHTEESTAEPIHLETSHYEQILRVLFPVKPLHIRDQDFNQATKTSTAILIDDPFKEVIRKVLWELQGDTSMKILDQAELQKYKSKEPYKTEMKKDSQSVTAGKSSLNCIRDALIEDAMETIGQIQWRLVEQLKIKGIIDKINHCLMIEDYPILVILKLDNYFISGWEETKNAFRMFGRIGGALVLQTTEYATGAKEYCCLPWEPIDYSLLGLYRDTALELTKKQMTEDSAKILFDILDKCKSHELCMKIFVHALYANPRRSNEELSKLHETLQHVSDNSMQNIAQRMLKFSYSDLPKEYKFCLMYLAIFPRQQPIRRSTLIGRWVVEGLITKEDWASSVLDANRCFDALVNRWFVSPADIGATGQAKSCVIDDVVHGFITKLARKQQIVETHVPNHLARYFSIVNNLQLRSSDKIDKFLQNLTKESSRVSLIKVLDLEGCQCFGGKNRRYLKDICSKMLLLKYLSLRGTNVTWLPRQINNLRELEVLDIRQTNVPAYATVNVLLLKLKRLLASGFVLSSGQPSSVKVPHKIGKMLNMEVLSIVKVQNIQDLNDIRKLWQLRKLGVLIEHKDEFIMDLLRAISGLHECLRSLSLTFPMTAEEPSNGDFTKQDLKHWVHSPKLLDSLSITGTTQRGKLLKVLTKESFKLAKVTLTRTKLKQADLKILAKLPKIVCIRLRDEAYKDSKLTFGKEEFQNLKCFLVEGSNITDISFEGGASKLEKIVLCSTDGLQSLSGVKDLQKLKEVELRNTNTLTLFNKAKYISKVTLYRTILSQDEVEILAKIPNMRSLVLREITYVQSQLIFYKDDFPRLNLLIVDYSVISSIGFTSQSATKLEKIIWSYTKGTLSGIENVTKLKELKFNGDFLPDEVKDALKKNKNKPKLIHNKLEKQYQEAGNIAEEKDAPSFPSFWKKED